MPKLEAYSRKLNYSYALGVFPSLMLMEAHPEKAQRLLLHPEGLNQVVSIENIQSTVVNGQDLGIDGYLDIGLLDTMKDLFVNFIGAVVFSTIGYFYVKNRGKGKFARRFIPVILVEDED